MEQRMSALEHRWRQWIAENKMLGLPEEVILRVLSANGVPPEQAAEELKEAAAHPYFHAASNLVQIAKKMESILRMQHELAGTSPTADQIERRETPTREVFLKEFYSQNRPVILTGMMRDWKAMERWSPAYLRQRVGDTPIEVQVGRDSDPLYERNLEQHRKTMPFSQYVDMVTSAQESNDFYMVANNKNVEKTGLSMLLDEIVQFPALMDGAAWPGRVFFWFGPKGTITPIHHDPMNVILCQVSGKKRIKLWAPSQTPFLYNFVGVFCEVDVDKPDLQRYPLFALARPLEFVIEPGEVLFIPVGWWHYVKALDLSISVSMTNFAFHNTFQWANPQIAR
jgi:hypothetical protein